MPWISAGKSLCRPKIIRNYVVTNCASLMVSVGIKVVRLSASLPPPKHAKSLGVSIQGGARGTDSHADACRFGVLLASLFAAPGAVVRHTLRVATLLLLAASPLFAQSGTPEYSVSALPSLIPNCDPARTWQWFNRGGASSAVMWSGGVVINFGPSLSSSATAINNRGQIIGSNQFGPFLWDNGVMSELPGLTSVSDINDRSRSSGCPTADRFPFTSRIVTVSGDVAASKRRAGHQKRTRKPLPTFIPPIFTARVASPAAGRSTVVPANWAVTPMPTWREKKNAKSPPPLNPTFEAVASVVTADPNAAGRTDNCRCN